MKKKTPTCPAGDLNSHHYFAGAYFGSVSAWALVRIIILPIFLVKIWPATKTVEYFTHIASEHDALEIFLLSVLYHS